MGPVGIALAAEGLALVRLKQTDDSKPELQDVLFEPSSDSLADLPALIERQGLQKHPASLVLNRSRYSLLQVDAPAVEDTEMQQALTWQVQDMVDFPVDQLLLDYVDVPAIKGGKRIVYAVAAQKPVMGELVECLQQRAGLDLHSITVPAMALQNIASRLPNAAEGVGILNLTHGDSLLTLGRGDAMYLSRSVNISRTQLQPRNLTTGFGDVPAEYETLLLELQRSLDYYDSFFSDPPVQHIYLNAAGDEHDELIRFLDENLFVSVARLPLDEVIEDADSLWQPSQHVGENLLALGAALRNERLEQ